MTEIEELRVELVCARVANAAIWDFLVDFLDIPKEAGVSFKALHKMNTTGIIEDHAKMFGVSAKAVRERLGLPSATESKRLIRANA